MIDRDIVTELSRIHHRATDMRARERQLADAGENDPASDAWKTASILAASADSEFEIALVEAWPSLARQMREAEQWRAREGETQEALQSIGEEFGVRGGEPRVDGIRRVLTEQRDQLAALLREAGEGWRPIESAPRDGTKVDLWGINHLHYAKRGERIANIAWGPVMDWMGHERDDWRHGQGESFQPTHWRPLPAPPAAGAPDAED